MKGSINLFDTFILKCKFALPSALIKYKYRVLFDCINEYVQNHNELNASLSDLKPIKDT
jgi:hypothetical protein